MQYRQLYYFIKIVEAGSFSQAARSIHVAQPALSQQNCRTGGGSRGPPSSTQRTRGQTDSRGRKILQRGIIDLAQTGKPSEHGPL
jgi:hypothetical protein